MTLLMDPERVGDIAGITCMRNEGTQWIGMADFVETDHLIQNLGDGTYFHSGQLAVQAAVAHKLLTEGVSRVIITTEDPQRYRRADLPKGVDVWYRDRLIKAQEELATVPGVSVLIHDQTTCNLDFSCLEGDCPSFMTVKQTEPGRLARWFGRSETSTVGHVPSAASEPPTNPDPTLVVPADEFAMRITGICGTGVVTVAQVLGTAAMLDGYHVRGLDQIGLSQKAEPVVSDVRLSRSTPNATNRLGSGQAHLLMAFDQLVAGSDKGMLIADPESTVVVGSISATPTGEMITHLDVTLPTSAELQDRTGTATRAIHHWADATAITEDLFGQSTTANMFVVGMAVQAGALPNDPARIEEAIGINGVAVEQNIGAFCWGRAQVLQPELVAAGQASVRAAAATEQPLRAHAGACHATLPPSVASLCDDLALGEDTEIRQR